MGEQPKKGRLTLYEDLLSPEMLKEMHERDAAKLAEEAKKKRDASALMFKPSQLGKNFKKPAPKAKAKPTFASLHKNSSSVSTGPPPTTTTDTPERSITPQVQPQQELQQEPQQAPSQEPQQEQQEPPQQPPQQQPPKQQQAQKRGFDDWLANEDEEWEYYDKPRHGHWRGKKKKSKTNKQEVWSWDDPYDPSTPVNFLEYPKSDAYYDVNEAWKDRLYDARRREVHWKGLDTNRSYSEDEEMPDATGFEPYSRGVSQNMLTRAGLQAGMHFAPPSNMDFVSSSDGASRPQSTGPPRDYSDQPSTYVPCPQDSDAQEESNRIARDMRWPRTESREVEEVHDTWTPRESLETRIALGTDSHWKPPYSPETLSPSLAGRVDKERARLALGQTQVTPAPYTVLPPPSMSPGLTPVVAPLPKPTPKPLSAEEEDKRAKVDEQIAAFKAKKDARGQVPPSASSQPSAPVATAPQSSPPVAEPATPSSPLPGLAQCTARYKALGAKVAAAGTMGGPIPPVASRQPWTPVPRSSLLYPMSEAPLPPPESQQPPAPAGAISAPPTFNPEYYATEGSTAGAVSATEAVVGDSNVPRSRAPGQPGFASRLMAKMGYQKGQGLGADGSGIMTAVVMKPEKRKKKSDAEGGGFRTPNMGKIVGGKKKKEEGTESETDAMSEVIKLEGMLANMDVDKEIQDKNVMQEVGEELGKFGMVERLFIWQTHMGGNDEVFVKFTSQLSALRAVRELDGTEFADNTIKAAFFDAEKFERGEYV